ncbi:MAG: hypothetical protein J6T80_06830 [Paludibacteraceae bacterium]|nr:hypothetical protein [Paludibacteraceae bacterium]
MRILCYIAILANLMLLGGKPQILEEDGPFTRYQMTDSTTMEVYQGADSIWVVMTACAPQCSSCARVYNKEWQLIKTITPPFTSIFPLATIDKETGLIVWKDNDNWEY